MDEGTTVRWTDGTATSRWTVPRTQGLVKVSSNPLRYTLALLGQWWPRRLCSAPSDDPSPWPTDAGHHSAGVRSAAPLRVRTAGEHRFHVDHGRPVDRLHRSDLEPVAGDLHHANAM